ncbi:hypothetical protein R1flu_022687 [Riccia fluitans]|uniref:Amino acid transporter n=1 Tax=Riccia fluitans TaxID=41844 RepID=A0ABD1XPY0_9MARC
MKLELSMTSITEAVPQQPNGHHMVNGHDENAYVDVTEQGRSEEKPLNLWQRFKKKMFRMEMLLAWTLLGVVCGIALGAGLYGSHLSKTAISLIGYPGEIMLRSFKLLILPLMVFALMSGVFALRSTKTGSGKVTRWALTYYLLSMIIAVVIGIVCVYAINPGRSRPFSGSGASGACSAKNSGEVQAANSTTKAKTTVDSILDLGRDLIPENVVQAAAAPNYLGVMVFVVTFAAFLIKVGERAEPIIQMIEVCNEVVIKIIHLVILITPVGIASWIATAILKACSIKHLVSSLGLFIVTVLSGIGIHFFIALPLTLLVLARRNPLRAFKSWLPAFAMALGTSSSAATMPVSMECGIKHGCNSGIVNFVLPLGTNINRDGTALYEGVAVIFICQAHGRDLSVGQVLVIVIVATLAAIGTASIPHAGLITLITALQATGNSEFLSDLSLLYAVDWILGMFRTVCNVWGDACATLVVDAWLKKYGKGIQMSPHEDGETLKLEEGLERKDSIITNHAE